MERSVNKINSINMPKLGTYKTLTNQKKIEILEEAENTGNLKEVARKYGVCSKSIRVYHCIDFGQPK